MATNHVQPSGSASAAGVVTYDSSPVPFGLTDWGTRPAGGDRADVYILRKLEPGEAASRVSPIDGEVSDSWIVGSIRTIAEGHVANEAERTRLMAYVALLVEAIPD